MSDVKEFPKMVYRADGAKILSLIVDDPAALAMAAKDGWGDRAAAREAAAKAPKPAAEAPPAKGEVNKKLAAENLHLTNQLAALEQANNVANVTIADLQTRVGDLEGFLNAVSADENCPEGLKAAIATLLKPEGEVEAGAGKKTGGRKK